jgi:UDPglucose--hexose-1-phosphate uridylyltransferase
MGLAVLPPRLKPELDEMKAYLLGAETIEAHHKVWADELKQTETITKDNVDQIVDQALAEKFVRVLQDSGVFKSNNTGKEGFKRFLASL